MADDFLVTLIQKVVHEAGECSGRLVGGQALARAASESSKSASVALVLLFYSQQDWGI